MTVLRRFINPVSYFVLAAFFAVTLYVPVVQGAIISTDTVVNAMQNQQARDGLRAALEREDVKQQLLAQGVNPDQLQSRIDALTDSEVQQLAATMDQMPAGGDALGIAVLVFLVLLLTDILGYTDIFPFVKKTVR
jgi:hypothetical protein